MAGCSKISMTIFVPILASERSAAKLLNMKPTEFRTLVSDGVLPNPVNIDGSIVAISD